MRKSNILKKLLIVANILIVICLGLVLTLKTNLAYSIYWTLVPFIILLIILFISEVDKGMRDTDIKKSNVIKNSYNDSSVLATIFYVFIYLIIIFFDTLNNNIINNIYLIIGFFFITLIYELCIYLSIYRVKIETTKLLSNK